MFGREMSLLYGQYWRPNITASEISEPCPQIEHHRWTGFNRANEHFNDGPLEIVLRKICFLLFVQLNLMTSPHLLNRRNDNNKRIIRSVVSNIFSQFPRWHPISNSRTRSSFKFLSCCKSWKPKGFPNFSVSRQLSHCKIQGEPHSTENTFLDW